VKRGVRKIAARQPANAVKTAKITIWLHNSPRHPNTSAIPNRNAGRYAIVGVLALLQPDPSMIPRTATPATATIRIRKFSNRQKTPNRPAVALMPGILLAIAEQRGRVADVAAQVGRITQTRRLSSSHLSVKPTAAESQRRGDCQKSATSLIAPPRSAPFHAPMSAPLPPLRSWSKFLERVSRLINKSSSVHGTLAARPYCRPFGN
jgi:hypothetical protein